MADNLKAFLAENAIQVEEVSYPASKRFLDESGKPMLWRLKAITAERNTELQNQCKVKYQIPGTRESRTEINNEDYASTIIAECVVYPNLNDAELQQSYNVVGAKALINAMLTPGEYTDLLLAVQQNNGFQTGMDEKIRKAKN